jgi:hypothetical protein
LCEIHRDELLQNWKNAVMFHKVIQVYPTEDYKVYLYFTDGKIKLFDAKDLLDKGIFKKLKSEENFRKTCTALNDILPPVCASGCGEVKVGGCEDDFNS